MTTATATKVCSRCGGTDNPRPLSKLYACPTCGSRLLCYACDVNHNSWCLTLVAEPPKVGDLVEVTCSQRHDDAPVTVSLPIRRVTRLNDGRSYRCDFDRPGEGDNCPGVSLTLTHSP